MPSLVADEITYGNFVKTDDVTVGMPPLGLNVTKTIISLKANNEKLSVSKNILPSFFVVLSISTSDSDLKWCTTTSLSDVKGSSRETKTFPLGRILILSLSFTEIS